MRSIYDHRSMRHSTANMGNLDKFDNDLITICKNSCKIRVPTPAYLYEEGFFPGQSHTLGPSDLAEGRDLGTSSQKH